MPDQIRAFAAEVRAWLSTRLPLATDSASTRGMALVDEVDPDRESALLAQARAWQAELYDAGYADLDLERRQVFREVASEFALPDLRPLLVGLHIVAPALRRHGSPELQDRYLRGILRGDLVACQLFSEPEAGSDLAAVRTRAVPTEGGWLVTGQKTWTSNAHLAGVAELLVRTDPDAPKHRGLSLFMVDLDQPGVDVRPLRQMTGGASFNEVFLSDVFVPSDNVIGGLNEGWTVAMTSLTSERAALGGEFDSVPPHTMSRLAQMAVDRDLVDDPHVQAAVSDVGSTLFATAAVRARAAKDAISPELAGSVSKLLVNRVLEHATSAAIEIGSSDVLSIAGHAPDADWSEFVLGKPSFRIAGGTDEIQRNLIAERHLGLPREGR